jgi:hypothetical protein
VRGETVIRRAAALSSRAWSSRHSASTWLRLSENRGTLARPFTVPVTQMTLRAPPVTRISRRYLIPRMPSQSFGALASGTPTLHIFAIAASAS